MQRQGQQMERTGYLTSSADTYEGRRDRAHVSSGAAVYRRDLH
jgi:hypothetical protein